MSTAKRYLVIALSFALALTIFAAFTPRIAHAITATLVQVVNTASNPVMTRSVDEPARVPYFVSGGASCPFLNLCQITGSVVPAGMRLRVTRISGVVAGYSGAPTFAALSVDDWSNPVVMVQLSQVNGAFFGNATPFNQEVDFYVDEGHSPVLQVGNGDPYYASKKTLTITGYMVQKLP